LTLAVTAHRLSGGATPSTGLLAITALVLGMIAVPLTAHRCRTIPLLAVLSIEQLLLHWVFGAATIDLGCRAAPPGGVLHHSAGMTCLSSAAEGMPVGPHTATMWLAHAAAVIATAWVLAGGEAWLWRTAGRAVEVATAAPRVRPQPVPSNVVVGIPLRLPSTVPYPAASPRAPPTNR
jgi:hypothetical protein